MNVSVDEKFGVRISSFPYLLPAFLLIGKLKVPVGVNVSVDEKFGVRISKIIAQEERIEFEKENKTF